MLTAAEVARLGGQQAVYAFRQQLMSGMRGYATGGAVAVDRRYAPPSQHVTVVAPSGATEMTSSIGQVTFQSSGSQRRDLDAFGFFLRTLRRGGTHAG